MTTAETIRHQLRDRFLNGVLMSPQGVILTPREAMECLEALERVEAQRPDVAKVVLT